MTEPLTPESLAELRRLLDEYRSASGFAPIVDAWYALARGSIARLPAMLAAVAERDALAAKVELARELHFENPFLSGACNECDAWLPCETVRTLDEEADR